MATFKERLQEGMNLRGIKQVDLVKRTGLSASRISHYMNGRWEAKQDALYKIAKALNVNEAWLMGHDVPMERSFAQKESDLSEATQMLEQVQLWHGEEAVKLLELFTKLNENGRNAAIKLMELLIDVPRFQKERQGEE